MIYLGLSTNHSFSFPSQSDTIWVQLRPQDIHPRPNLPSRPTAFTNAVVPRPARAAPRPLSPPPPPPPPDKVLDPRRRPRQRVPQSISIRADDGLSLRITTYIISLCRSIWLIPRFRRRWEARHLEDCTSLTCILHPWYSILVFLFFFFKWIIFPSGIKVDKNYIACNYWLYILLRFIFSSKFSRTSSTPTKFNDWSRKSRPVCRSAESWTRLAARLHPTRSVHPFPVSLPTHPIIPNLILRHVVDSFNSPSSTSFPIAIAISVPSLPPAFAYPRLLAFICHISNHALYFSFLLRQYITVLSWRRRVSFEFTLEIFRLSLSNMLTSIYQEFDWFRFS